MRPSCRKAQAAAVGETPDVVAQVLDREYRELDEREESLKRQLETVRAAKKAIAQKKLTLFSEEHFEPSRSGIPQDAV